MEAIATRVQATATTLEAITTRVEAIATRVRARMEWMGWNPGAFSHRLESLQMFSQHRSQVIHHRNARCEHVQGHACARERLLCMTNPLDLPMEPSHKTGIVSARWDPTWRNQWADQTIFSLLFDEVTCRPKVSSKDPFHNCTYSLERRETRKVGQREEKRTREAGTKMQCSTW